MWREEREIETGREGKMVMSHAGAQFLFAVLSLHLYLQCHIFTHGHTHTHTHL